MNVIGPTSTTDGNYVLWEGATGGSVKVGGQPTTLDAETGNLTGVSGIELDGDNGNVITIVPPTNPSTHTLTLPTTQATGSGHVLKNDGSVRYHGHLKAVWLYKLDIFYIIHIHLFQ